MDGVLPDGTNLRVDPYNIPDSANGINAMIPATHRQNFLIPPRRHRQPANFSWIDFRLHNPAFLWHLIISFDSGPFPQLQPFRVCKDGLELGISADDNREGSELAYPGPEVVPLSLLIDGTPADAGQALLSVLSGLLRPP